MEKSNYQDNTKMFSSRIRHRCSYSILSQCEILIKVFIFTVQFVYQYYSQYQNNRGFEAANIWIYIAVLIGKIKMLIVKTHWRSDQWRLCRSRKQYWKHSKILRTSMEMRYNISKRCYINLKLHIKVRKIIDLCFVVCEGKKENENF